MARLLTRRTNNISIPVGRDCPAPRRLGGKGRAIMTDQCLLPTGNPVPMVPASRQGRRRAANMAKARAKAKAENGAKAAILSKQRAKARMASRKAKEKVTGREVTPRTQKEAKAAPTNSFKSARRQESA